MFDLTRRLRVLEQENLKLKSVIEESDKVHESEIKILNNEIDTKVNQALKEQTQKVTDLTIENGVLVGKNEMYEKAFENLGFDVKDMKEILYKVVDGLVAKNQIKLIKD